MDSEAYRFQEAQHHPEGYPGPWTASEGRLSTGVQLGGRGLAERTPGIDMAYGII